MNILITGASSGLGSEIFKELESPVNLLNWSLESGIDITKPESIEKASKRLKKFVQSNGKLDGIINCAGVNYINWFQKIPLEEWDRVMNTNARGIFLVSQACLPYIKKEGFILNVISNASHMPMSHSAAYNASKAAAEMLTKQMARELRKTHGLHVFGVSPNKLAGTGMSKEIEKRVCKLRGWSKEKAREYQLAALPAGIETDPSSCAAFICFLIENYYIYRYLNGCILPFGA